MILVKESKKLKMEKLMAFCSFQRIILAILYKGNNIVCVLYHQVCYGRFQVGPKEFSSSVELSYRVYLVKLLGLS